ncbi:glycosyltransferase family 4 protein [Brevibacterium pigmentatum]|uniref:glycosyltransferase family 4 protein n=1 Tax=Brevibacterium pigmentatum TaxID=1496080 RepID=UPI00141DC2D3|nr:glycosyltransferase family 1 protein [Brevibacterium pigmentatum]
MYRSSPVPDIPVDDQPDRQLRVLVVAESFLPQVNGVTGSVCRTLDHLRLRGHSAAVVAPTGPDEYAGAPVITTGRVPLIGYSGFRLGVTPAWDLSRLMRLFQPDVVHLASPFVLGATAARTAYRLGIPAVAIYQTDVAGFADRYGMNRWRPALEHRLRRIHHLADRTLAPSHISRRQLEELGVRRVHYWPRGVDLELFSPEKRSESRRRESAPGGEVVVGYVGRLSPEKSLERLQGLQDLPGIRLVLVGEGPSEPGLRALLPDAVFLGPRSGEDLAEVVASFDLFVHTGTEETFCQSAQEALASGVPVIGPEAGGLLERVDHGRNGLLYSTEGSDSLFRAVHELAADPERRRRMGRHARAGLEGQSWQAVGDRLLGHYRAVASAHSVPTREGRAWMHS